MSGEWSVKLFTLYETFEKDINCQYMSHFRLNQFDETKTEIVYLWSFVPKGTKLSLLTRSRNDYESIWKNNSYK